MSLPVNLSDDIIQVERSSVSVILMPDILSSVLLGAVTRDGIVNSHNHSKKPGEGGQDLVSPDSSGIVRLPACEWIDWQELALHHGKWRFVAYK